MADEPMTWEGLCPLGDECPFPSDPDFHEPHCGHGLEGHHHHWPKRSKGGKRIVTFLCPDCHRKADEGIYINAIQQRDDGTEDYILSNPKNGRIIVDRAIGRWKDEEPAGVAATMEVAGAEPPAVTADAHTNAPPSSLLSIGDIFKALHMQPHPTGLTFADEQTEKEWALGGRFLGFLGKWLPWAVGDWLKQGQWRWGEKYAQAASETGLKEERLQQYQWVAEHVENCTRCTDLSWSHHREVADLPADKQGEWLQRARDEGMTANELRLAIQGDVATADECSSPESPDGKHGWQRVCRYCGQTK